MSFGEVCGHGQLKRKCEICELNDAIEELRAEIKRLRTALTDLLKSVDRERIGAFPYQYIDHACKECEGAAYVRDNFLCEYHFAKQALSQQEKL